MLLNPNEFKVKYGEAYLQHKITEMCLKYILDRQNQYKGKVLPNLVCLCVLKGAFRFFSEMMKHLTMFPMCIDFIQLSTYDGENSTEQVKLVKDVTLDSSLIERQDVLIIEDIIDSGFTLDWLVKHLRSKYTLNSIKIATLLNKTYRRKYDIQADYSCIDDNSSDFLVGFGLDDNEFSRNLNQIYMRIK